MVIDGKKIAQKIEKELKPKLKGKYLSLGIILANKGPESKIYVNQKLNKAKELGIKTFLYQGKTEKEVLRKISQWNKDQKITGIIVQLPLPENFNQEKIIEAVNPKKDVDGLTSFNQNLIEIGEGLIPATPLAALEIIDHYKINPKGKKVAILGRSKLVGEPIARILKHRGAKIKVGHSKTPNLATITKDADILISAVGKPNLITGDMVKKGVFVINIGSQKINQEIVGDFDYPTVAPKASFITPVVGGIGPITVIKLMENVLRAYKLQNKI